MEELEKYIRAYALKNAIEFGEANAAKVLPKLFQHGLDKKDMKEALVFIQKIVDEINVLSPKEREEQFESYKEHVKEREEKDHALPELPNAVMGKVVTRLPPEPSKYLHIGHALSFLFNYLYAQRYKGKCLLRFEDANPEKVTQEYVDAIKDDLKNYLDIRYDDIHFVADDMDLLYSYAEKLVTEKKAFMCFCDRESMQNLRHEGKECPCRKNSVEKNTAEWKKFLNGEYMQGEAVLRFKGDMQSQNHVMRDPVLFRAISHPHFKYGTQYKIWPLYDFYNPIEDSIMGVTHILRSNEFELRVELQNAIKDALGLSKQTIVQYGRINVIEATTKGREIRDLIATGEYMGWDDPRLVTLKALKRRGITREALYELANHMGLAKKQVNLDFDMIAAINRKILDEKADRYYFVQDPVKLTIQGAPEIHEVAIKKHPAKTETRKLIVNKNMVSIARKDYESFKGKEIRLMNLYNIKLTDPPTYGNEENKKIQKIQWVSQGIPAKILMPSGEWVEGLAEENVADLAEGTIIQFERVGFCRLDKKTKESVEFWFTHQ